MATEWFENKGTGVAVHVDEPNILLIGDYIPDWVLIPPGLADSGKKLRVQSHLVATCPKCRARTVRHLVLEDEYRVAECSPPGCGFVWYKLPKG